MLRCLSPAKSWRTQKCDVEIKTRSYEKEKKKVWHVVKEKMPLPLLMWHKPFGQGYPTEQPPPPKKQQVDVKWNFWVDKTIATSQPTPNVGGMEVGLRVAHLPRNVSRSLYIIY